MDQRVVGVSDLTAGITHTQVSLDSGLPAPSVKTILKEKRLLQNQNLMGWGANNPEPTPGIFDWQSLDSRINLIRETSGTPVITLCCAPDWMKGGQAGSTDWSKLNEAPLPEHYGNFAALAGHVARRYPDVKHYQVWHGFKGFYDRKLGRWNYEGYTNLYNLVLRELKSVNPDIKVGGPYTVINSWSRRDRMSNPSKLAGSWGVVDKRDLDAMEYWLKNKEGADFVALDMSTPNKDGVAQVDPAQASEKIFAVGEWLRERTDLPVWASRWNLFPPAESETGLLAQSAALGTGLIRMLQSGVNVELLWEPQGRGQRCSGCLWSDTRLPGGDHPTVNMAAIDLILSVFPPGTSLLDTRVSSTKVSGISSPLSTVLINHSSKPLDIRINGNRASRLDPSEIRVFPRSGGPGT